MEKSRRVFMAEWERISEIRMTLISCGMKPSILAILSCVVLPNFIKIRLPRPTGVVRMHKQTHLSEFLSDTMYKYFLWQSRERTLRRSSVGPRRARKRCHEYGVVFEYVPRAVLSATQIGRKKMQIGRRAEGAR